jgi:hypothetical protein
MDPRGVAVTSVSAAAVQDRGIETTLGDLAASVEGILLDQPRSDHFF